MSDYPGLQFINYQTLSDGVWKPGQITDHSNAFNSPPIRIMYLWLFDRQDSLCGQLVSHGWTSIGPVHLLISPAARVDSPLLKSSQAIDQAIRGFRYSAGQYQCPKLIDYEYRPRYRGYPINYLWCSNNSWVYGFESLANRSDHFVMDISAEEQPEGLIREISYLLQNHSLKKVIFLFDKHTGVADLVDRFMQRAWDKISPGSVNDHRVKPIPVIQYSSANILYLAQATFSLWSGKSKVPLARRAAQLARW